MSSERGMWRTMREGIKGVEYQRFEDKFSKGIPDLALFDDGGTTWIELKYSPKAARPGYVQQLPHFTVEQRRWLKKKPFTNVLWQIDKTWLLFRSPKQFDLLGHIEYEAVVKLADFKWEGTPNWNLLVSAASAD